MCVCVCLWTVCDALYRYDSNEAKGEMRDEQSPLSKKNLNKSKNDCELFKF